MNPTQPPNPSINTCPTFGASENSGMPDSAANGKPTKPTIVKIRAKAVESFTTAFSHTMKLFIFN